MKLSMLSFMTLISMAMASLGDHTMPSHTMLVRSPSSINAEKSLHDISKILRRSAQPAKSAGTSTAFSPSVLRAQDATAASSRKATNAAIQSGSTSHSSSPHSSVDTPLNSPPGSPPVSPRTAGRRADEAERAAAYARNKFNEVGLKNLQRANAFSRSPPSTAHRQYHADQMNHLQGWQDVADAKREQASAYSDAADAARRAGRKERYLRNSQKAAASRVLAQYHDASVDVSKGVAGAGLQALEHADLLVNNPHHRGEETNMPTFAPLKQVSDTLRESRATRKNTFQEARRLRKFEGGRDTDSASSPESE